MSESSGLVSNIVSRCGLEVTAPPQQLSRHETMQATYSYVVHTADGRKIVESGELPCQSFLQGFLQIMAGKQFGLASGSAPQVYLTNGWRNAGSADHLGIKAAATVNTASIGPLVGIGSVPVAITHSSLTTQVNHGTGANQLQHAAVTFAAPTVSGTATLFTVTRVFTNASAGALVVKEIGLAGSFQAAQDSFSAAAAGSRGPVLLIRDLIGGGTGVSVGSGAQLTLNINFRTNV